MVALCVSAPINDPRFGPNVIFYQKKVVCPSPVCCCPSYHAQYPTQLLLLRVLECANTHRNIQFLFVCTCNKYKYVQSKLSVVHSLFWQAEVGKYMDTISGITSQEYK